VRGGGGRGRRTGAVGEALDLARRQCVCDGLGARGRGWRG